MAPRSASLHAVREERREKKKKRGKGCLAVAAVFFCGSARGVGCSLCPLRFLRLGCAARLVGCVGGVVGWCVLLFCVTVGALVVAAAPPPPKLSQTLDYLLNP
ncbi:hypothetical protein IQ272_32075 [Chroococcidiopsidales cyanobacterium LEGE 13417]|nr:hypothetical protein [Chroococcidiopsidales cyanobacterium LEGE 13417]